MRLKNIILTGLAHERLIAYEELERIMNAKSDIEETKVKVRKYLKKIVTLNAMISEWEEINTPQKSPITELKEQLEKTQQDG